MSCISRILLKITNRFKTCSIRIGVRANNKIIYKIEKAPIIIVVSLCVILGTIVYFLFRRTNILLENLNLLKTDINNIQKLDDLSTINNNSISGTGSLLIN